MTKGHCPDCWDAGRDSLREISPTGERRHPDRGTDKWWKLVMHSDGQGGLCPGGGKKV